MERSPTLAPRWAQPFRGREGPRPRAGRLDLGGRAGEFGQELSSLQRDEDRRSLGWLDRRHAGRRAGYFADRVAPWLFPGQRVFRSWLWNRAGVGAARG